MPFLLAAVVVGAGAYGVWRAVKAFADGGPAGGMEPKGPEIKDLGTFERDPETGIYRRPDGTDK